MRPGICASCRGASCAVTGAMRGDRRGVSRPLPPRKADADRHPLRSLTLRATPADDPDTLSLALQGAMGDLELQVSMGAAAPGELLVVDGPLGARRLLPGTVGYIKTQFHGLFPGQLSAERGHGVIGAGGLTPGQRTPVFCMGERFARYSWYLRLPGEVSHPWAGVVRCEAAMDVGPERAMALADRLSAVLPRFASSPHKDPRAHRTSSRSPGSSGAAPAAGRS